MDLPESCMTGTSAQASFSLGFWALVASLAPESAEGSPPLGAWLPPRPFAYVCKTLGKLLRLFKFQSPYL